MEYEEKWINDKDYNKAKALAKEIGAMLWSTVEGIKKNNDNKS